MSTKLPHHLFASSAIRMDGAAGRDQVALSMWARGWMDFERPLPEFYSATINDGDIVLDVGANTGYYSLLAASVGPNVRVHAFEPLPEVLELLRRNVTLNASGRQVEVHAVAVDEEPGSAELFVPLDTHHLVETSASLEPTYRSAWARTVNVEKTTLDDFTASLERVDVVKIDVECLEHRVLAGAQAMMDKHRPAIFLEVLCCEDWKADCAAIDEIRRRSDYLSVRLRPRAAEIVSHVGYDEPWRNQALWPVERVADLERVCQRLGRDLLRVRAA